MYFLVASLVLTFFSFISLLGRKHLLTNMGNCPTSAGPNKGFLCDLTPTATKCCTLIRCTDDKKCPSSYPLICSEYPYYACFRDSPLKGKPTCTCQFLNPFGRSLLPADADPIEELVETAPDFDKYDDRKSS